MAISTSNSPDGLAAGRVLTGSITESHHPHASAVSWAAILAGAAAAAALSLILLILGTGLGLSSVSPWTQRGLSATTMGISTVLWITFTQLAASGLGGYLAGRLRTRWVSIHRDEAYFRDTAHGFLAWAVASLATAALLASATSSIVATGVQAGATVAGGVAGTAAMATAGGVAAAGAEMSRSDATGGPMAYFMDSLFRRDSGVPASGGTPATAGDAGASAASTSGIAEASRIIMNTIGTGALPADDLRYVAQLVAQRTGLSQPEAEKRVTDTYARAQAKLREAEVAAKEAADKARKATAYAALWLFVSLLIGAFFASLAATYGGQRRDLEYHPSMS